MTSKIALNRDFADMLIELGRANADYVIVGGYAVAGWGFLRATKDIDILVRPSPENATRVLSALARFGAPLHNLTAADLSTTGTIFQIGVPPRRIDIITSVDGISYDDAIREPRVIQIDGITITLIGLDALLKNKHAAGRPEDLKDLRELKKIHRPAPTKKTARTKTPRRAPR